MNLDEMIERLEEIREEVGGDFPVRGAFQPNYVLLSDVDAITTVTESRMESLSVSATVTSTALESITQTTSSQLETRTRTRSRRTSALDASILMMTADATRPMTRRTANETRSALLGSSLLRYASQRTLFVRLWL